MKEIGLPYKFAHWIMLTVRTVAYRFNVNGMYTKLMPAKRGIKQGDPLSLIMFVIMMEYLNRLLCKMQVHPIFKFHSKFKAINLTHVAFADDVLMFSRGDAVSISKLIGVLQVF